MFRSLKNDDTKELDKAIADVTARMHMIGPDSEEYSRLIEHLAKLTAMKTQMRPSRPSMDTMLVVGGNLLGILVIVSYEHAHVIGSKALGFIMKNKI